jgi:hypothetical protein
MIRMMLIYLWGSKYNLKGFRFIDVILNADIPYFNQEDCRVINTIGHDYRIILRDDSRIFPMDINNYFKFEKENIKKTTSFGLTLNKKKCLNKSESNKSESNESESNDSESNESESNKSESNESESNESESNESESNESGSDSNESDTVESTCVNTCNADTCADKCTDKCTNECADKCADTCADMRTNTNTYNDAKISVCNKKIKGVNYYEDDNIIENDENKRNDIVDSVMNELYSAFD